MNGRSRCRVRLVHRRSVDAARVARGLGLDPGEFRRLNDSGRIRTLCERGIGADDGRYRLTFFHGRRRLRLVTDAAGRMVASDYVDRAR